MKLYVLIIFLLFACMTMAQPSTSRQLFIFGKEENEQAVKKQLKTLEEDVAGVKERNIKTIVAENEDELYKKYKVQPKKFLVLLIGKDGGEKYRTSKILKTRQLFALIDAMPMRRAEMNKKTQ